MQLTGKGYFVASSVALVAVLALCKIYTVAAAKGGFDLDVLQRVIKDDDVRQAGLRLIKRLNEEGGKGNATGYSLSKKRRGSHRGQYFWCFCCKFLGKCDTPTVAPTKAPNPNRYLDEMCDLRCICDDVNCPALPPGSQSNSGKMTCAGKPYCPEGCKVDTISSSLIWPDNDERDSKESSTKSSETSTEKKSTKSNHSSSGSSESSESSTKTSKSKSESSDEKKRPKRSNEQDEDLTQSEDEIKNNSRKLNLDSKSSGKHGSSSTSKPSSSTTTSTAKPSTKSTIKSGTTSTKKPGNTSSASPSTGKPVESSTTTKPGETSTTTTKKPSGTTGKPSKSSTTAKQDRTSTKSPKGSTTSKPTTKSPNESKTTAASSKLSTTSSSPSDENEADKMDGLTKYKKFVRHLDGVARNIMENIIDLLKNDDSVKKDAEKVLKYFNDPTSTEKNGGSRASTPTNSKVSVTSAVGQLLFPDADKCPPCAPCRSSSFSCPNLPGCDVYQCLCGKEAEELSKNSDKTTKIPETTTRIPDKSTTTKKPEESTTKKS